MLGSASHSLKTNLFQFIDLKKKQQQLVIHWVALHIITLFISTNIENPSAAGNICLFSCEIYQIISFLKVTANLFSLGLLTIKFG